MIVRYKRHLILALGLVAAPYSMAFCPSRPRQTSSFMHHATNNKKNAEDSNDTFYQDLKDRAMDFQVEQGRQALEDQNTKAFLRRKPLKLPYAQARQWVQQNWDVSTQEEYEDLVQNGNLRTPYIPKQPEEYYTSTREWISWEHFLRPDQELDSVVVAPATGVFD